MKMRVSRNKWGHDNLLTNFTTWVGMLPWRGGTATSYFTNLWDPVPQLACFLRTKGLQKSHLDPQNLKSHQRDGLGWA